MDEVPAQPGEPREQRQAADRAHRPGEGALIARVMPGRAVLGRAVLDWAGLGWALVGLLVRERVHSREGISRPPTVIGSG